MYEEDFEELSVRAVCLACPSVFSDRINKNTVCFTRMPDRFGCKIGMITIYNLDNVWAETSYNYLTDKIHISFFVRQNDMEFHPEDLKEK